MLPLYFPVVVLVFAPFAPTITALPAVSATIRNVLPLQLILQRPYYCDMNGPPGVKLEACGVAAEFCCPQGTTCWSGNGTEVMCAIVTRQIYPGSKCDAVPVAPQTQCGDNTCCGPYMTCAPGRGCVPDGVIPGGMASLENPICNATINEFQCGTACCASDQGEVCNTRIGACETQGTTMIQESFPAPSRVAIRPGLDGKPIAITPQSAGGPALRPAPTFPAATGASLKTGPGLPPPPLAERALMATSSATLQGETRASESTLTEPTTSSSESLRQRTRAQSPGLAVPMQLADNTSSELQHTRTSQQFIAVPTIGWVAPVYDNSASMAAPVGTLRSRAATAVAVLVLFAVHV